MAIRLVHSRFSQLKQPLILWLDSQSVQLQQPSRHQDASGWQVALSQGRQAREAALAEVAGPSLSPEEGAFHVLKEWA